jgi:hypothetical protein
VWGGGVCKKSSNAELNSITQLANKEKFWRAVFKFQTPCGHVVIKAILLQLFLILRIILNNHQVKTTIFGHK